MVIIETDAIFESFLTTLRCADVFYDVVLADVEKHSKVNPISLHLFKFVGDTSSFCLVESHNEGINNLSQARHRLSIALSMRTSKHRCYVFDKKKCLLAWGEDYNFTDLNVIKYLETGKVDELDDIFTNARAFVSCQFRDVYGLNRAIPIYKHAAEFNQKIALFPIPARGDFDKSFKFLNNVAIPQFAALESVGLKVDATEFSKFYTTEQCQHVVDGMVRSQYNLFTATGRPSNRFGGVNYAAMNKADGSRLPFISRHGADGMLVMMDYSAFHPRLIAKLVNYDIGVDVNPYEYLAPHFFNKQRPSEIEIIKSKELCFQQMYGGILDRYQHIPYFQKTQEYIDHRWKFFSEHGYIETPIYFRKIKACHIENPSPNKLFNYILQAYETEIAVQTMGKVMKYLKGKPTQLDAPLLVN